MVDLQTIISSCLPLNHKFIPPTQARELRIALQPHLAHSIIARLSSHNSNNENNAEDGKFGVLWSAAAILALYLSDWSGFEGAAAQVLSVLPSKSDITASKETREMAMRIGALVLLRRLWEGEKRSFYTLYARLLASITNLANYGMNDGMNGHQNVFLSFAWNVHLGLQEGLVKSTAALPLPATEFGILMEGIGKECLSTLMKEAVTSGVREASPEALSRILLLPNVNDLTNNYEIQQLGWEVKHDQITNSRKIVCRKEVSRSVFDAAAVLKRSFEHAQHLTSIY